MLRPLASGEDNIPEVNSGSGAASFLHTLSWFPSLPAPASPPHPLPDLSWLPLANWLLRKSCLRGFFCFKIALLSPGGIPVPWKLREIMIVVSDSCLNHDLGHLDGHNRESELPAMLQWVNIQRGFTSFSSAESVTQSIHIRQTHTPCRYRVSLLAVGLSANTTVSGTTTSV